MRELIKISETENRNTVSARDLHEFLDISTDFTTWCKRMFEYGFEEEVDYTLIKIGERNSHNKIDYALTLDCAKEISMLQRTDRGKQARKYFIECEKKLKQTIPKQLSRKELAYMVIEAEEKAERLQLEIDTKHKPRSQFVDVVFNSDSLINIGQAAKILGLGFGRNTLFKKLKEQGVLFKNSNEPKQQFIEKGYFKIKEKTFKHTDGSEKVTLQTFVTQKGLAYLAKIFGVVQMPVNNSNQPKFISA